MIGLSGVIERLKAHFSSGPDLVREYCPSCGQQKIPKKCPPAYDLLTGKRFPDRYYFVCPIHEANRPAPPRSGSR